MTHMWGNRGLRWDDAGMMLILGILMGHTMAIFITQATEAIHMHMNGTLPY